MEREDDFEDEAGDAGEIDRVDTLIRLLVTLLFFVIARAAEAVLGVVIAFELVYALATRQLPSRRVRDFANRVIAYLYRIGRYMTYNESAAPFPFRDFPPEVEPPGDATALGTGA